EALRGLADPAPFAAVPWEGVPVGLAARADLIVNATPVGQAGEDVPIDPEGIRPGAVVADVVYHPPETRLVLEARERGASAFGGLGMLVRQAALSFEIWTRRPAPLEAMWAAARGEEVLGG
ncbi:MAG: shikimate dehydrogenase family protein, partial [Actinomycetota bacterium]